MSTSSSPKTNEMKNYECASSILFCPEDSNSALGFDEREEQEQDPEGEVERRVLWHFPGKRSDFYGDSALPSEDCIASLVERELQHLPQGDYAERLLRGQLDLAVRNDAIDWMQRVHEHYNFGPLSAYLSVNYLDRFFSSYEVPQGKAWMTQLLSMACLSLAAKVEETEVPLSLDLQVGEAKYVFEARTIQRMELLVLGTLKWRMQAVTPFSFIVYFLCKFHDANSPDGSLISRSIALVLATVRGVDFLEFRPSEIAAAVALSALKEIQFLEIAKALACCIHVNKERVLRCHEVIQEMALMKSRTHASTSISTVPKSPIGVLDAACLSYKSDDTAVGSHANCDHSSPAAKRRKPNRASTS
ncbi:cell division [Musa troglodytarum]|uniref:Cell division n=1 Tax=Musa troglodytarum TaxID=320322 RepID=A0A9E7I568_9LILI|nr:cell division [Musa troglodytarum]